MEWKKKKHTQVSLLFQVQNFSLSLIANQRKKINVTNRRSRRRTRSIGRSKKKKTAVNHLEAKAASCRQELDAAGISLFQAFGWWSAARRKRAEKIRRKKGRGREEARSHLCPTPSLIFFCSHIHRINLYAWDSEISFPNTYPLDSDLSGG